MQNKSDFSKLNRLVCKVKMPPTHEYTIGDIVEYFEIDLSEGMLERAYTFIATNDRKNITFTLEHGRTTFNGFKTKKKIDLLFVPSLDLAYPKGSYMVKPKYGAVSFLLKDVFELFFEI